MTGKYTIPKTNIKEATFSESKLTIGKKEQNIKISHLAEFRYFREEIYAATEKKMLLVTEQEIKEHSVGRLLFFKKLRTTKDIPKTREMLSKVLETKNVEDGCYMNMLLAVSELTTNVIKHAERGSIMVIETDEEYICLIQDKGPGFELRDLKDKTLAAGYSTKDSLGFGFSILLKLTDQLLLANTDHGSIIAAKFRKDASDRIFYGDPFPLAK
ncbi:ATP-binding protein [Bacillus sp. ISL-55]|uniref:ATP-binding protein n=1 Tax=Bacillus sp. ISL-55 TaxID=2819134 RepID=UPI001BE87C81|nr:ATP-binding protein [Bacillus sp. ISL-55]MBT2693624.1 ATP-binding protein [Bacillus sp. ISL-55]